MINRDHSAGMGEVDVHELLPAGEHEGRGVAVVLGDIATFPELEDGPLIRMHSRCQYGEIFDSIDCECGPQLIEARKRIVEEGQGILFYLDQEGRGAGLITKALGYRLRDEQGLNTAEAYKKLGVPFDQREYGHCARFLVNHGIRTVRLMSNNPRKIEGLTSAGINVTRVPLIVGVNDKNREYLRTKEAQGHLFGETL